MYEMEEAPVFTTPEDILQMYFALRGDATERDQRYDLMVDILNKEWHLKDSAGEAVAPKSSNQIGTALEDTAEAAAAVPTIRVRPRTMDATSKNEAATMEYIAAGYFDHSMMELEIPRYVMDLGAFGLCPLLVIPDFEAGCPKIVKKDPLKCYFEKRLHPGDHPKRALFVDEVSWGQLEEEHRAVLQEFSASSIYTRARQKVILIEWYTDYEISLYALMKTGRTNGSPEQMYQPVMLEQEVNPIGVCPVIPMTRVTWDGQYRGQFDDVIDPMLAYARLQAMAIDFADQTVYSDLWAKDVIGDVPFGGGSFIELGPNGAIGRVPAATSSLDLQRDLDRLSDDIHVGGRWPKSRPGQIDQAIASGKFIEATVGMMSTVIKTHHQVLARGLSKALWLGYLTDKTYFAKTKKTTAGVRLSQAYLVEYTPSEDINLDHRVTVEYGLGLGRDANSSAVLMMNYSKDLMISRRFVRENIEGLTDVDREERRLDTEKIETMMFGKLLQAVEENQIPMEKLPDIFEAREKGKSMLSIFKGLFAPEAPAGGAGAEVAALAQMLGLGGGGAPPAAAPGGGAPMPMPPAPPDGREMLARIGVPAGPGAVMGSQVQG